jgi:hypothetical protein
MAEVDGALHYLLTRDVEERMMTLLRDMWKYEGMFVEIDSIPSNPCNEVALCNDQCPSTHRKKHASEVF